MGGDTNIRQRIKINNYDGLSKNIMINPPNKEKLLILQNKIMFKFQCYIDI